MGFRAVMAENGRCRLHRFSQKEDFVYELHLYPDLRGRDLLLRVDQ